MVAQTDRCIAHPPIDRPDGGFYRAIGNQPTEHQQLKRSLGKASYLLETQQLPVVTKNILTRPEMRKMIALFEQLSQTADLSRQHRILEAIEREYRAHKARARRDLNIRHVLGPV